MTREMLFEVFDPFGEPRQIECKMVQLIRSFT